MIVLLMINVLLLAYWVFFLKCGNTKKLEAILKREERERNKPKEKKAQLIVTQTGKLVTVG